MLMSSYQMVGHVGQVSEPGDFFTGSLGPYRFIIAKGPDGTIRAFHNVRVGMTTSLHMILGKSVIAAGVSALALGRYETWTDPGMRGVHVLRYAGQ
jgi:hypothetical protein